MSDKELEGTKRFDIYLHLNEEMKAIKDVCGEEYNYEQLILDAHDLALLQFPKCSKESVFVSHERMVNGRRCKSPLTCDYGLKRLFSSNQSAYVLFVKCYDDLPGFQLLGKFSRSYKVSSPVQTVDSSDSSEELIKQASTSLVENIHIPLASIAGFDEKSMMVCPNQLNQKVDRTNHVSVTQVYESEAIPNRKVYVRKRGKVSSSQPAILHHQDMVARVDVLLASISEAAQARKITTMEEKVPLASIAEVEEESMLVNSNQLGDRTHHVSVTRVYLGKGGKVPLSQRPGMVTKIDVPLASIAEERDMVSYNQFGDRSNRAHVYVRKRKLVKQVE